MKKIIIMILSAILLVACQNDTNVSVENQEQNQVVEVKEEIVEPIGEEVVYGDFKGYMWEIKHGDATVYLFGSVHIANSDIYPFHESVEKAYDSSDALVVEADISKDLDVQELTTFMSYNGEDTIYNHLSPEGIVAYEEICESLGIEPMIYQKLKIWANGSALMAMQLMRAGYMSTDGVDMYFLDKANGEKDILELESIKFQLEMMNNFSDQEQEDMFIHSLGTIEETVADFDELYDRYVTGDIEEMTDFLDDSEMDSDVEQAMLIDRNIKMAEGIDAYLQTDKTYFIVVGLAHYLGEDSVVELLIDKGYNVEFK